MINFCIKCFKGQFNLDYHNKKSWGLKCDQCFFRVILSSMMFTDWNLARCIKGCSRVD